MYDDYMAIAAPGMKADSGFDRVESFAASEDVPFGVVVVDDGGVKVKPGDADARGIALSSHAVKTVADGKYAEFDAVSVMTRGLCWALVAVNSGTTTPTNGVTKDGPVYVSPDGTVTDDEGTPALAALPNAVFRSGAETVTINGKSHTIAMVELHNPFA